MLLLIIPKDTDTSIETTDTIPLTSISYHTLEGIHLLLTFI